MRREENYELLCLYPFQCYKDNPLCRCHPGFGAPYEHRNKLDKGSFTAKYDIHHLMYYEYTTDVRAAIEREKQIKRWSRAKKEQAC